MTTSNSSLFSDLDFSNDSSNESLCTITKDNGTEICRFWIQGVLLCIVGVGGIVGNAVSLYVLSRPQMLSVFNQILVVMTAFDTIYLFLSVAEFSFVETFNLTSESYDRLFVYFLYPLHNITLCCSIFSHVLLAFERYLAVCHPELVYSTTQAQRRLKRSTTEARGGSLGGSKAATAAVRKKVLIYIVPVVIFSVLINAPRWLELELKEYEYVDVKTDELGNNFNETVRAAGIAGTWLRYNQSYVTYYLHWTILLSTGIFPLVALAFLNSKIYFRIKQVQKVRTNVSHTRNEPNYAATLASIIVIFVVCHLPRVIKTIFEIIITNKLMATGQTCDGINPAKCLANVNNFILTLNAASSFLVYCFVGTFGTQFVQVLTACCRKRETEVPVNGVEEHLLDKRKNNSSPSDGNLGVQVFKSNSSTEKPTNRLRKLKDISVHEANKMVVVQDITAV